MKRSLPAFFFLFMSCAAFGQSDSARIQSIITKANDIYKSHPDSAFALLNSIASDNALQHSAYLQAQRFRLLGVISRDKGDFPNALDDLDKALSLFKQSGSKDDEAACYNNMANVFLDRGEFPRALDNYFLALKIHEETKNQKGIARAHNNIGIVFRSMNDHVKALEHYNQAYLISKVTGDSILLGSVVNNIGNLYSDKKEYAKAQEFFLQSVKIREALHDRKGLGKSLDNLGLVYNASGDHTRALDYLNRSLEIKEQMGDKTGITVCLINIAAVYIDWNRSASALPYLGRALSIARATGNPDNVKECYNSFYAVYSNLHQPQKALDFYIKYISLRDSLVNIDRTREVTRKAMQFDFDRQETRQKAEQEKKDLEQAEKLKRELLLRNVFIAGSVLLLGLALVILRSLRQNRRAGRVIREQKKVLEEKNAELERLSIVASETENVILILDAQGRLEWVNQSFEKLNDITLDELRKRKGETIYEISNNPNIRSIIEQCVKEKRSYNYESFNLTRDGKQVWESSTLTPIFSESGELRKLIIIDTDVTEIKKAEETIRQKNKDITDSINYAKRIQDTILPKLPDILTYFPESFVLFRPRDIVSGDFYWFSPRENNLLIAAADCTGHGVPGALMSMIGSSLLHQVVNEKVINNPAMVLAELDRQVNRALQQTGVEGENRDGMDIAFAEINVKERMLRFAGANRPLYLVRKGVLEELSPDKIPVGGFYTSEKKFTNKEKKLEAGDMLYLFSDGYADQFGGEKKKKFMTRRFKELLSAISSDEPQAQREMLEKNIVSWMGPLEQVDDILVIGIRIN
ncbi:MAG TPA: tetratricopeptide repeat protein [Bacteroidia bacterium]